MALATYQHTPIKDLDALLRYLTEDLGYRKGVAVFVMNERYKDGHLWLTKVEYVGVKPQGEVPIDPKFGHIELDHGRMRFVPRERLWRKAIYKIAEGCDARAIWPPRPPASQTSPDEQQDERLVQSAPSTPTAALPPSPKPAVAPSEKTKETMETRLINFMKELHLESGLLPREVLRAVKQPYKDKYHDEPSQSSVTRAYNKYTSTKQSAE
jgi:hypothetical protein